MISNCTANFKRDYSRLKVYLLHQLDALSLKFLTTATGETIAFYLY